ncbi:ATP synthase subunit O, mitochondrial [Cyclospora cayetanensis]|uniref:ATP synthase subunit O, mitochondrial n=1 Tax=Cyclospora cayetanensis TaxID=88456 RepID=A0A6P6RVC0_9EIME|nr:ATP synthase subunit O, mitochondrial [Cyclospora cayetanensis]
MRMNVVCQLLCGTRLERWEYFEEQTKPTLTPAPPSCPKRQGVRAGRNGRELFGESFNASLLLSLVLRYSDAPRETARKGRSDLEAAKRVECPAIQTSCLKLHFSKGNAAGASACAGSRHQRISRWGCSNACKAPKQPLKEGSFSVFLGQFRSFSSSAECSSGTDRHSVEGRYAHALMAAAQGSKALDAVYTDVEGLHAALQTSPEFGAFAETPGITAEVKIDVVQQMAERFRLHKITKQFLCTVAENKRMVDLPKILAAFDELYRKHRGEVRCTVTSAQELTTGQRKELLAALQKRAGPKKTLLTEFQTNPSIAGGLLVRMGDELLDFTVASRVEGLITSLQSPLTL